MSQTKIRNVSRSSVGNFGILSDVVVVCSAPTALCRAIKYLSKIPYFNRIHPNVARFYIFEPICLGRSVTLPKPENNITKKVFDNT